MESSWWERGAILGGWAIAGLFALAAIITVFRSGDDAPPPQQPVVVSREEPREPQASSVEGAVQAPRPTPNAHVPATSTPVAQATPALALSGCDLLRTSPNWSPQDREWFLANCLGSGPAQVSAPLVAAPPATGYDSGSDPQEPAPPPAPTAVPQVPGDEQAAIALAIDWLGNDAPVAFNTTAGSCTATSGGLQWVITCRATLAGCGEAGACVRTISVCVYLEPPSVAPLQSC
jgi:hypothetical protein